MKSGREQAELGAIGCSTTLLDAIGALVVISASDGRIVHANRACLQLTGRTIDEMKGQLWDRFVAPEEADAARDLFRSLGDGRPCVTHEHHWLRRCGEPRLIAWSISALPDVRAAVKCVIATGTDVTEQRRNERALSDLDERFRKLTENIPEVFSVRDLGNKSKFYVSPRYETLWGRSAKALQEDPEDFIKAIHPDDRERIVAAFRNQTPDAMFNEEYRLVRPDGSVRWIRGRAFPIFNDAGEFHQVAAISEDITGRRQSEQALRESEARLRKIVDLVPQMIFVKDREGRFLLVNKAMADVHGMNVDQLIGRRQQDLMTVSASTARMLADDREVMESGQPEHIAEERFVDVAGNERIVETVKVPYSLTGRDGPAVLGVATDITERRRMAQALAEEAERYRLVVNSLAEAVVLIGADGRYRAGNANAARIVGVAPENLVGRPFFPQSALRRIDENGKHFPLEQHPIAVTLRTGQPFNNVVMGLVKEDDTVLWLSINTRPTFRNGNSAPDAVVVSLMDITAQKNAEAALARSEEQMRQAMRVVEVGVFEYDHRNDTVYCSPQYRIIRGLDPLEPITLAKIAAQVHPEDAPTFTGTVQRAHDPSGNGRWECEYRILRKSDGAVRWMRSRTQTFFDGAGAERRATRTIGATMDITEQKESEAIRIGQAIEHREALIREVHHRIKNNLQGVIGLLRQETVEQPALQASLDRAVHRLRSVAMVHGLEGRTAGREVHLRELLQEIVGGMSVFSTVPAVLAQNLPERQVICLAPTDAVAIALIINELLMNAVKHSRAGEGPCEIRLSTDPGKALVTLTNPGTLPSNLDLARGLGIGTGLSLVRSLLPRSGAGLILRNLGGRVQAEFSLRSPVVTVRTDD